MPVNYPPLYYELPYTTDSAQLFERIRHMTWPVYLDSANTTGKDSRYDILAAAPFIKLQTRADTTLIETKEAITESLDDPFLILDKLLARYQQQRCDLPFTGGAIGYFGYDLGRRIETLPILAEDAENIPELMIGFYDWAVIVDHHAQRCWLTSYGHHPETKNIWPSLVETLSKDPGENNTTNFKVSGELSSNFSEDTYQLAFEKIQHYITEGDCYQVNLANRFEIDAEGDAWFAYKLLRSQNAAPFSAFLDFEETQILSSSPERFIKLNQQQVETKPIKGTRARDLDDAENDLALSVDLQNSTKDRAENLMIVDLLRNDLGKACQTGSIEVPKPFALESFATVHHLVSTITGRLTDKQTAASLLRACFPGGSITGAPKLRAMEIIEELEPHRRGIYCGSIAYLGFDGNMDSNITIRTLIHSHNKLRFWAGGGIVSDSQAGAEYQEVHDKAAAMKQLVEQLR